MGGHLYVVGDVTADGNGKHQSQTYPERAVHVGLGSDVTLQEIDAIRGDQGPFDAFEHVFRRDVEILLEILDGPNRVLGQRNFGGARRQRRHVFVFERAEVHT